MGKRQELLLKNLAETDNEKDNSGKMMFSISHTVVNVT